MISCIRLFPEPGPVISLNSSLPPIDHGRHFSQMRESTAEAARSGIAETQGDHRYALVGLKQQVAGRIEAHFRNHVTVARAHHGEMTLQRARAHPQLERCTLNGCVTMIQRGSNRRTH